MPPLTVDVRPCRRAQLAWTLFGVAAAVALGFDVVRYPEWPAARWPLIAAGAALALVWQAGLAVLGARGPLAVRRFDWAPDGEWRLERPDGGRETACLTGATATLGPWILLAWTVEGGRWRLRGRRYALIGVWGVSPADFRTLRGRLSLLAGRHSGRSGVLAP